MLLAHGGTDGSLGEGLLLALPLLVVGVVFLFQKRVKPAVSIGVIGIGIAIVVASMIIADRDRDADAASGDGETSYVGAVTGLCEARRVAATEPDEAARLFRDEVHVPLHDLAAQVEGTDRVAAATLLEAKQAVEADLDSAGRESENLEHDLSELLDATIASLAAIDLEAPTC